MDQILGSRPSVLAKLRHTPADALEQFLPDVWKADDAAEPIPH